MLSPDEKVDRSLERLLSSRRGSQYFPQIRLSSFSPLNATKSKASIRCRALPRKGSVTSLESDAREQSVVLPE
jgi:hypothetical protein